MSMRGVWIAVLAMAGGLAEADSPDRWLLLDQRIVERVENAKLVPGEVVKHSRNPLFGEEHPWEARFDNVYPNVLLDPDDGKYKVWYKTFTSDAVDDDGQPVARTLRIRGTYRKFARKRSDGLCYAVSDDGLTWTKPLLDIHPFEDQPSNLVALNNHGVGVLRDPHDDDPQRRFKMLMRSGRMAVRFSPDGIHWGDTIRCAEINAAGDTHNNALWVPEQQRYVAITRLFATGPRQRTVGWSESPDFVQWTPAKEVLRGTVDAQVYSMPIFQHAGVFLGLPAIFFPREDVVHTELAWSPDSVTWHRVAPGTPLIPRGSEDGDYDWGCVYASPPVIGAEEVRLYYGASNGPHTDWRDSFLALATLRPDGFAGYEPQDPQQPALVVTRPLKLRGRQLRITADVAEGGSVEVTLFTTEGRPFGTTHAIRTSVTDAPAVTWEDDHLTEAWASLHIRHGRVYSLSLAEE